MCRKSSRANCRATLYHFKSVFLFLHMLLTCSVRWNMSTGRHTTFTQCIEHLGKHSTIRNSVYMKPSTVLFNSSSGTTFAEAVNIQRISIFRIREDVWHFSHQFYSVIINSHNGQLTLHNDSGAVRRERRTIVGTKFKLLHSEIALSRKPFGIWHMYIYILLLRMTDNMTSKNIDLSSWDTVYNKVKLSLCLIA
jgi:hypothetical protein